MALKHSVDTLTLLTRNYAIRATHDVSHPLLLPYIIMEH